MTLDRRVDYDAIAGRYDRRYQENDYSGIERALVAFVGNAPLRVLEVGCGTGHWLASLAARGHAVDGADASSAMLAKARAAPADARLVHARAERLPWRSGCFDRVFCVNAFHHFEGKSAFLAEAQRVLRPGGGILVVGLDPHTGLDRWWIYDAFPPVLAIDRRRYPPAAEIRCGMLAAGFARAKTSLAQHIPWQGTARAARAEGRFDKSWTSQLSVLSDDEFAAGALRIEREIEAAAQRGEESMLYADLRLYATAGWVD